MVFRIKPAMIAKKKTIPNIRTATSRQLRITQPTFSAAASATRQAPNVTKKTTLVLRVETRMAAILGKGCAGCQGRGCPGRLHLRRRVCKAMQYLESVACLPRNVPNVQVSLTGVCCHMKGQECCLGARFSEELVLSLQNCG